MGLISNFVRFRNKTSKDEKTETEMSFLDHLEELRWHLLRAVIAIAVGGFAIFFNIKYITDNVVFWPFQPDFPLHQWMCSLRESLCFEKMPVTFINTKPYEMFMKSITLSFIGGVIIAFPYIFWEIWRFITPGLHNHERRYLRGTVFFTSLLFFTGVVFSYFIIVPFSAQFLSTYTISDVVNNQWTFGEVITMVSMLVLAGGVMFQLPIVVFFLTKIGFVTPKLMKDYRRHSVVVLLIIAAIITPPDVTSQILIFIPLQILYEISIGISASVIRGQEARALAEETSQAVN